MARTPKNPNSPSRPDLYAFHDYREFLRAWVAYRKATHARFSLRSLAKEAGLAVGYLSMVLSGSRGLSSEALGKLTRPLGLTTADGSYLELLRTIAESDSQEVRMRALEGLHRFRSYQKLNPKEIEAYRYLTHWYYVAIREMSTLEGFRAEPQWIQARLRYKVPLKDIEQALDFLKANGYLDVRPDGTASAPDKDINCVGGVFRVAIVGFHQEMLSLASRALESVPVTERSVTSHTMTIRAEDYDEVKRVLDEALTRVAEIGKQRKAGDVVYQVSLATFPLTKGKPGRDE